MNSLVRELVIALIRDLSDALGTTDTARDISTVTHRSENEGDSFFTITLPEYCKEFERALEVGRIDPQAFPGFCKAKGSLCVPAFLQGHMLNVFGRDGCLLQEPSPQAVLAIRQICLFAKKVERDCSPKRKGRAVEGFLETERDVREKADDLHYQPIFSYFGRVADIVMSDILDMSFWEELVPRHGSGATANRARGNAKWSFPVWPSKLEECFPFSEFGLCSLNNYEEFAHECPPIGQEPNARLALVPKTLKTPRIIAIEPSWNQFIQQGLMRWLVPRIESGKYTKGGVNFRHQGVNFDLAREASITRKLATLDLSEASDRVSLRAVHRLLKVYPHFRDCVDSCRSDRVELADGQVVHLSKFASMGSALCFPIEAMVFFCTIVAARIMKHDRQPSPRSVYEYSRNVYVYGDDLIVPTDEVDCVVEGLEAMGLKVNTSKSFSKSYFRESCGGDFYKGVSVRPVYFRRDLLNNKRDARSFVSNVSTANQLFDAGLYRTSQLLKDRVESIVGKLPTVDREGPALGWYGFSTHIPKVRFNDKLQRREFYAYVVKVKRISDPLEGDGALGKCLRIIGQEVDEGHLARSVSPRELAISRKWIPLAS